MLNEWKKNHRIVAVDVMPDEECCCSALRVDVICSLHAIRGMQGASAQRISDWACCMLRLLLRFRLSFLHAVMQNSLHLPPGALSEADQTPRPRLAFAKHRAACSQLPVRVTSAAHSKRAGTWG